MLERKLRSSSKPILGLSFIGSTVSGSSTSSFTFSSVSIGTASDYRLVVAGVTPFLTATNSVINSVTIAGVTATQIGVSKNSVNADNAGIYAARIPTGTTGNIVVNTSATAAGCGLAVWTITNSLGYFAEVNSTGHLTAASNTRTYTNVRAGDVIIAAFRIRSASVGTYTTSGATENYDQNVLSGTTAHYGASTSITQNQSNYSVVVSTSGASPVWTGVYARFYL